MIGSGDAPGGELVNAPTRNRTRAGWPMDVGRSGPPNAPASIMSANLGNPTTVRQPDASSLNYQVFTATPDQHHVTHGGSVVGYVQKYQDPGHGPLWAATLHDSVHAKNPDAAKTVKGFVYPIDAAHNVMDRHRDVAQIENSGSWRP